MRHDLGAIRIILAKCPTTVLDWESKRSVVQECCVAGMCSKEGVRMWEECLSIEFVVEIWAGQCWKERLRIEFATEFRAGKRWEECVGIELPTEICAGIDCARRWAALG